jgi:prepilin-type N-terminal cleavage/methylation domain-containing protein
MVNKHRSRSGFTLVELLVVIVIVSLLSALTLGALRSGGIRAKEDSARSFIVHISDSLLELFRRT